MQRRDFDLLIADHARFPAVIRPLYDGVPIDLLRERPAADKWSPLEILVHLLDEERFDFRDRAQTGAEGRIIVSKIDPQGWVASRGYNTQDPAVVLADFIAERAASVQWLRGLDVATLNRTTTREGWDKELRCGDFIAAWRMHDILHLRQLATTFARLEHRRLDGWETAYAGEIP